jgi:4-aminobutyrate aminotransferase
MSEEQAPHIVTDIPGPRARDILERQGRYLAYSLPTAVPIVWAHAEGAVVTDIDGNRFIDFSSGVVVMNTGHSHPLIVQRISDQIKRLVHCWYAPSEAQVEFLEGLAELLPPSLRRILPVTIGAEALEVAVKMARAFTGKSEIISFWGAFHGRTYLTMAMAGLTGVKQGFGPLPTGHLLAPYAYCYRCPYSQTHGNCALECLTYLETMLRTSSKGDVAALVVEPYQGSAGTVIPPREFTQGLREFCDRHDIVLIFDEVQSSFGRTGKNFAFEHYDLLPDIVCLGKGIASGVPTSAVAVREDIAEALLSLRWTSTFAANPLSCAAASASIEVLVEESLSEKAARQGQRMLERLQALQDRWSLIGDVRGIGLALGVEFVRDRQTKDPAGQETARIFEIATRGGLILIPPVGLYGNVLRIVPPLSIPDDLADKGLDLLEAAICQVSHASPEAGLGS